MGSSVRSLANHYETLGLSPTATSDEVTSAFAARMRSARMRPDMSVARLAELSVAYETLRDPAKRYAYDLSIGIGRPAIPPIPPSAAPFIGMSTIDRLNRLAAPSPLAQPAAQVTAVNAKVEPRVAAFIAASLRPQMPEPEPELQPEPRPEPEPELKREPVRSAERPQSVAEGSIAEAPLKRADQFPEFEDAPFLIGRTGATLGACVVGVVVLSVALAVPAPNPDRLPAPTGRVQPALTVPLPAASAAKEEFGEGEPAAIARADVTAPSRTTRQADKTSTKPASPPSAADDGAPADNAREVSRSQLASIPGPPEQIVAIPAAVEDATQADPEPGSGPTAARLPLPNSTIARTIHRIGYACGQVTSTTPLDGAGVFKVTCSSGQSYRAAPVGGRYHFRRLGSH